jgi:hypothetical protein
MAQQSAEKNRNTTSDKYSYWIFGYCFKRHACLDIYLGILHQAQLGQH